MFIRSWPSENPVEPHEVVMTDCHNKNGIKMFAIRENTLMMPPKPVLYFSDALPGNVSLHCVVAPGARSAAVMFATSPIVTPGVGCLFRFALRGYGQG